MNEKAIICIDDEKIVLDSLKSQLHRNLGDDFTYEFAEDVSEGMEVLEELIADDTKIVLLVSDWLMPGMKDDVFLIKVHEKYPEIKKVLLTGQADTEAVERTLNEAELYKYQQTLGCGRLN